MVDTIEKILNGLRCDWGYGDCDDCFYADNEDLDNIDHDDCMKKIFRDILPYAKKINGEQMFALIICFFFNEEHKFCRSCPYYEKMEEEKRICLDILREEIEENLTEERTDRE